MRMPRPVHVLGLSSELTQPAQQRVKRRSPGQADAELEQERVNFVRRGRALAYQGFMYAVQR